MFAKTKQFKWEGFRKQQRKVSPVNMHTHLVKGESWL